MTAPDVAPDPTSERDYSRSGAARSPRGYDEVRRRVVSGLERNALLLLLVAVVIFFSVWPQTSETFPSVANVRNLLGDQTVVALMAIGAIFPLLVGEFDLSIGYLVAFLGIFNASAMARFHLPLLVAMALTLVIAATIGLITGLAVSRLGLPSLVITLATGTLMSGVVLWYSEGLSIVSGISPNLITFGSGTWFGIPRAGFLLLVVTLVAWHFLERTPSGRYLRFIGSNRDAARLVGVRVNWYVTSTFVISATLSGVAAIALTARNGAANPGDGPGLLFPAIAAAFLGATTVRPGQFNVLGTVIGVFFVAVSVSGLNLAGAQAWVPPVFYGASLALAVLLSTLLARRRAERQT